MNPPKRIWLQWDPEGDRAAGAVDHNDVTWCAEQINSNDLEYVLVEREEDEA